MKNQFYKFNITFFFDITLDVVKIDNHKYIYFFC